MNNEKIQALNEKKAKLLEKKEGIEKQIKEIDLKIKEFEAASTKKELDETVIVLKNHGVDIKDVLKALRSGNIGDIEKMLKKEEKSGTNPGTNPGTNQEEQKQGEDNK